MDSYCDRCGKKHNQEIERERVRNPTQNAGTVRLHGYVLWFPAWHRTT